MRRYAYFAYGSNLDIEAMARRCPDALLHDTCELPGWRLTFRGVADIVREGDSSPSRVVGGLWYVSSRDLQALDIYEGAPRLYRRVRVDVETPEHGIVRAVTYVMTDQRPHSEMLPSEWYLSVVADGYKDWGLDVDELLVALRAVQVSLDKRGIKRLVPDGRKRMKAQGTRGHSKKGGKKGKVAPWLPPPVAEARRQHLRGLSRSGMSPATESDVLLGAKEVGMTEFLCVGCGHKNEQVSWPECCDVCGDEMLLVIDNDDNNDNDHDLQAWGQEAI